MSELPENWSVIKLGDLVKFRMGPTILAKDLTETGLPVYSAGKENIAWGFTNKKVPVYGKGTIVISARGSIGYPKLPKEEFFTSTQTTIAVSTSDETDTKYIKYFLESTDWGELVSGASIPMLTISALQGLDIALAPLNEQKRIAEKLDSLLARVDSCQSHLERVPQILKRFRQSVLAAAMEGRLLENEVEIDDEGLPIGWKRVNIEDACERIVDCLHSTPKFTSSGHYCVDSNWIKPGVFVFEKARFVNDETFIERNRRMKPQEGDVVFSREGALLGVAVYVPNNFEFCLGQRMMIFRPNIELNSKFLEFFLNSQTFRSQYSPLISGSAAPHLNIGDIRTCKIPLPPLEEQAEIVRRVEKLLAYAERLEARYTSASEHVERLTPSLLAKAFRGELVSQEQG